MPTVFKKYLHSDPQSTWHVGDLLHADTRQIRLIFVLESPHSDEIDLGLPVVGQAGKSALRFLQGANWAGESLGRFVADRHVASDARLAIMNVSTVPLQGKAFNGAVIRPDLTRQDWAWLGGTFRKSKARLVDATRDQKISAVGRLLLDSVQERIDQACLDPDCVIVACGRFAQRYVSRLRRLPRTVLNVPHPAKSQWHPKKKPVPNDLIRARELFTQYTT